MNWLLIIIVLLLALCVVNGYRKGFLRMMYSMVSWVIMFALVTWATPYINTFLRTFAVTELAANAAIRHKISFLSFLCFSKCKTCSFNRLF